MVQLSLSMMERYEIAGRRPRTIRAMLIGADRMMLGVAARLLDAANEAGADLGAVCVTGSADALNAQDGMFTLLVRGEDLNEKRIREERVVQSILQAVNPAGDAEAFRSACLVPELEWVCFPAQAGPVETALLAKLLRARWDAGLASPEVWLMGESEASAQKEALLDSLRLIGFAASHREDFIARLGQVTFRGVLCESLSGRMSDAEAARVQQQMNYRDDFLGWAEPQLKCVFEGEVPEALRGVCPAADYADACVKKARIFDSAVFLCAAAGYLCGMNSFSEVLKDETLRAWIGHAFFDEILPSLPYKKEEIAPVVISAFERLENPMNDVPLLDTGRDLMRRAGETLLPSMRAYADRTFEAPKGLAFALSAAIMLYAGARANEDGNYEVLRGEERALLHDDEEILEAFSRFSHDMPAETLAYAALADRSIWGADLRDIDGLEMRVAYDIAAIQRIGFRESLRLKTLEWED